MFLLLSLLFYSIAPLSRFHEWIYIRQFKRGGVEDEAWKFFAVCIPVCVIGAPLGTLIGSYFHRLVLAACIYITDTVQLIGALVVVEPWTSKNTDTPLHLMLTSGAILVAGAIFFFILAHLVCYVKK